jgi:hypothetical protein
MRGWYGGRSTALKSRAKTKPRRKDAADEYEGRSIHAVGLIEMADMVNDTINSS